MRFLIARRAAKLATPVVLFAASLFAGPASAGVFAFNVQLGSDGIGHFLYDDDNGGPNFGFTKFTIDLSPALGSDYSAIALSPTSYLLPGGHEGDEVFDVLTQPLTLPLVGVSFSPNSFTVPIAFSFFNMGWPPVFGPLPFPTSLCTVPGILAGQYGYCTADASGVGDFVTTAGDLHEFGVPEPPTALLFLGSLALMLGGLRRREAPAETL